MKKLKKGLSLLAVIAFLITALIPISGMAASHTGTGRTAAAPIPTTVYGSADGTNVEGANAELELVMSQTNSVPASAETAPIYALAGSKLTLKVGTSGGPAASGYQWKWLAASSNTADGADAETAADMLAKASSWAASDYNYLEGGTAASDTKVFKVPEEGAAASYCVGATWTDGTANYCTPIYTVIPVRLTMGASSGFVMNGGTPQSTGAATPDSAFTLQAPAWTYKSVATDGSSNATGTIAIESTLQPRTPVGFPSSSWTVRNTGDGVTATELTNGVNNTTITQNGMSLLTRAQAASTNPYQYGYVVNVSNVQPWFAANDGSDLTATGTPNNAVTFELNVSNAQATVASVTASPNAIAIGQAAQLQATVSDGITPMTYQWGQAATASGGALTQVATSSPTSSASIPSGSPVPSPMTLTVFPGTLTYYNVAVDNYASGSAPSASASARAAVYAFELQGVDLQNAATPMATSVSMNAVPGLPFTLSTGWKKAGTWTGNPTAPAQTPALSWTGVNGNVNVVGNSTAPSVTATLPANVTSTATMTVNYRAESSIAPSPGSVEFVIAPITLRANSTTGTQYVNTSATAYSPVPLPLEWSGSINGISGANDVKVNWMLTDPVADANSVTLPDSPATVTNGSFVASKVGTYTVTATGSAGGTVTYTINVKAPDNGTIAITSDPNTSTVTKGGSPLKLTASTYQNGTLTPIESGGTWGVTGYNISAFANTSNGPILNIDQLTSSSTVPAEPYTFTYSANGKTASFIVTVADPVAASIAVGGTNKMDGKAEEITGTTLTGSPAGGTWSISPENSWTSLGVTTEMLAGATLTLTPQPNETDAPVTYTITYAPDGGGEAATQTITVQPETPAVQPALSVTGPGIILLGENGASTTVEGYTATLTNAPQGASVSYAWASSDTSVATVAGNNTSASVTGLKAGDTTITVTATYGDNQTVSGTLAVKVVATAQEIVDNVTNERVDGGPAVTPPTGTDTAFTVTLTDEAYTDLTNKQLAITQIPEMDGVKVEYSWDCEPPTDSFASSATNTAALPTTAGVYTITGTATVTPTNGTPHTKEVEYQVVLGGNLGSADAAGTNQQISTALSENGSVALYPSWNSADTSGATGLGAPATNQVVTYVWSVQDPTAGSISPTVTTSLTQPITYTAVDETKGNTVNVTAYAKPATASQSARAIGDQSENGYGTEIGSGSIQITPYVAPTPLTSYAYTTQGKGAASGKLTTINTDAANVWTVLAETDGTHVADPVMNVNENDRFEIFVPTSTFTTPANTKNDMLQWEYRTSAMVNNPAGGDALSIPTGVGYYGVNDYRLISTPVTANMDGWQFRLVHRNASIPEDTWEHTPWFALNVAGADKTVEIPEVTITSTPAQVQGNVDVTETGTVTFKAEVQHGLASANLAYQWQSRVAPTAAVPQPAWTDIADATDSTYTITDVPASLNNVSYRCIVSNNSFSGIRGESNALTLNVNAADGAVVITAPAQPEVINRYASRTASFAVEAETNNGDDVTYQWYMRASIAPIETDQLLATPADVQAYLSIHPTTQVPVSGATESTYTTGPLAEGVYEYVCRVTNAKNTTLNATSAGFFVVVTQRSRIPNIIESPGENELYPYRMGVIQGTTVQMTCKAEVQSQETLTYQWQAAENQSGVPGVWTDLTGQTSSTLRIADVTGDYNTWWFRCNVKNTAANTSRPSNACQLFVWSRANVPVTGQITRTAAANDTQLLQSTATVPSNTAKMYVWWKEAGDERTLQQAMNDQAFTQVNPVDGTYTSQITATPGTWTCVWLNADNWDSDWTRMPPYATTPAFRYGAVAQQLIAVQPTDATAAVGTTATFAVGAVLPGETGNTDIPGQLVYVWQRSLDGGITWKNCTSSDGSGQYTSTFSIPVTQAVYDYATAANMQGFGNPFTFRVNVANRPWTQAGITTYSDEVRLVVTAGQEVQPTITVKDGVENLAITKDTPAGTILSGTALTANKDGHKVSEVEGMLSWTPENASYALRAVSATNEALTADDIIGTGCKIQLIDTGNNDAVLDTITVIVRGDVMGSGVISLTQLVKMAACLKTTDPTELEGAYLLAGDFDGNGDITITDLVQEATIYRTEILDAAPAPTPAPTAAPTTEPSAAPTTEPTAAPTTEPTAEPIASVTPEATETPSAAA